MFGSTAKSPVAADTIADAARTRREFSVLASVVNAAALAETLASPGPFTVFAPTDDAFSKLPGGAIDRLLQPENRVELASFVTRHILAGRLTAAELRERAQESGGPVALRNVDNGLIEVEERDDALHLAFRGARAMLLSTDLPASNGVIHVTDTVLTSPVC